MEKVRLDKVRKGEYITFGNSKVVYIRGEYNRHSKKYSTVKFEDINHERQAKGSTLVNIDFDF